MEYLRACPPSVVLRTPFRGYRTPISKLSRNFTPDCTIFSFFSTNAIRRACVSCTSAVPCAQGSADERLQVSPPMSHSTVEISPVFCSPLSAPPVAHFQAPRVIISLHVQFERVAHPAKIKQQCEELENDPSACVNHSARLRLGLCRTRSLNNLEDPRLRVVSPPSTTRPAPTPRTVTHEAH